MTWLNLCIVALLAQSTCCLVQNRSPAFGAPKPAAQETSDVPTEVPASIPTVQPGTSDSYVIGAADLLTVTVWKETTLSGPSLVRPDGMISMPLLGDVQASGLTPPQLASKIEKKLTKYIQSPNVTVEISQIHSKVIYMLGEVGKKGPIDMASGMTLLQAISSAGGLTDYANTKKIYILRSQSGKQVKIPVRYKEALRGDGSLNLILQPGDTIVVP